MNRGKVHTEIFADENPEYRSSDHLIDILPMNQWRGFTICSMAWPFACFISRPKGAVDVEVHFRRMAQLLE